MSPLISVGIPVKFIKLQIELVELHKARHICAAPGQHGAKGFSHRSGHEEIRDQQPGIGMVGQENPSAPSVDGRWFSSPHHELENPVPHQIAVGREEGFASQVAQRGRAWMVAGRAQPSLQIRSGEPGCVPRRNCRLFAREVGKTITESGLWKLMEKMNQQEGHGKDISQAIGAGA